MLPHTLRGTSQSLALAHPHHVVEVFTDHSTPGIHLMGYHIQKICQYLLEVPFDKN